MDIYNNSKNYEDAQKQVTEPFCAGGRKKLFTEIEVQKMLNMRSDGISYRKIAATMKCAESTVRNYLRLK